MRRTIAWLSHMACNSVLLFYALVVSIRFGNKETATLFTSWGVSYFYGAILLEPAVICILAAFPFIATEETRVGRCCLRIKWVWDELLSP